MGPLFSAWFSSVVIWISAKNADTQISVVWNFKHPPAWLLNFAWIEQLNRSMQRTLICDEHFAASFPSSLVTFASIWELPRSLVYSVRSRTICPTWISVIRRFFITCVDINNFLIKFPKVCCHIHFFTFFGTMQSRLTFVPTSKRNTFWVISYIKLSKNIDWKRFVVFLLTYILICQW